MLLEGIPSIVTHISYNRTMTRSGAILMYTKEKRLHVTRLYDHLYSRNCLKHHGTNFSAGDYPVVAANPGLWRRP